MAVLCCGRQHCARGRPCRDAFGPGVPAGGNLTQRVLIESCARQRLLHLGAHRPGGDPEQIAPVALLDTADETGDVLELGLEKLVQLAAHDEAEDFARAGQRGIHALQLVELLLKHVQLLERILEDVALDPEILQHLLQLADFLGDVLGVNRRHALGRGAAGEAKAERRADQKPSHPKSSNWKSMNSRSAA